jgi:hypothetical protein
MSFTAEFLQEQLSLQPFIPSTVVMNSGESCNIRSCKGPTKRGYMGNQTLSAAVLSA